jgi:hypothetical protein
MNTVLLKTEAVGARIASYSCPRGTVGRIHVLRLRRRFQPPGRPHSIASGNLRDWNTNYNELTDGTSNPNLPRKRQQQQSPLPPSSEVQPREVHIGSESHASLKTTFADASSTTASYAISSRPHIVRKVWQLPAHLVEASQGDTAGLWPIGCGNNGRDHGIADNLRKALQTESPHAIMNALTKLITISRNKVHAHAVFRRLSPNTFTEILRCLDPEHFVTRYINLQRNNVSLASNSLIALRRQEEQGMYRFCVEFMTRVKAIILARRSSGSKPSMSDYKSLLRCAAAVENPRASQTVWRAMESDGYEPDTECYNYYLSGILKVGISNGTQRSDLRTRYVPRSGLREPTEVFQSYYERLGVNFRYETTKMFDDMLRRGVAGDERTFCLLMISSARVGDIDSVKSILVRVWGINVDTLMTKNEKDCRVSNSYPMDSPFRPSVTLLLAIAHCFGINNMVPIALRLIDYVSRIYSLAIPIQVWEDLLGVTYAISLPNAVDGMTMENRPPNLYLRPEAVSVLWSVLTSEPYNIEPNLAMYDRLIVNLLRRQRFGEARERMEEARKVYFRNLHEYEKSVAIENFQSSFFEREDNSEELGMMQGTTAYENYLGSRRDKTFHHLNLKFGRQYFSRWCRMMINLGSRSLLENPTFVPKTLPRFIHDFRLFMPPSIRYQTGTGYISFPSGVKFVNWARVVEKKKRPRSLNNSKAIQGATLSKQTVIKSDVEDEEHDYDNEYLASVSDLDSDLDSNSSLDSEEDFGKS